MTSRKFSEQQRKSQSQTTTFSAVTASSLDRVVVTKGECSQGASNDKTPTENDEANRDEKCVNEITPSTAESEEVPKEPPEDLPRQKNKKRCWKCKAKLELAQRELGICKCGEVFFFFVVLFLAFCCFCGSLFFPKI